VVKLEPNSPFLHPIPEGKRFVVVNDMPALEDIPAADLLNAAKSAKKAEVDYERVRKYYTEFNYGGNTFHGDVEDIENIKEAILTANHKDGSYFKDWKTKTGMVSLDQADFFAINDLLDTKKTNIWGASFVHKTAIDALTTVAAVEAYDITVNWNGY